MNDRTDEMTERHNQNRQPNNRPNKKRPSSRTDDQGNKEGIYSWLIVFSLNLICQKQFLRTVRKEQTGEYSERI